MNLLIVMPRLRTIGRVHVALWQARAAWGRAHTYMECQFDQPYADGYDNVVHNYRRLQQIFLAGAWDAMLSVEDDIIVPPHAITDMVRVQQESGAGAVYGIYCLRRQTHPWNLFGRIDEDDGVSLVQAECGLAQELITTGRWTAVPGVGLGCTLITRAALQAIAFQRRGRACNDWYFAVDAQRQGILQVAAGSVVCGHMDTRGTTRVIWPQAAAPMYRIEEVA